MNSKSRFDWIEYAQTTKKILLFYKQKVIDVTQFIKYHPGGVKAIKNYVNKDVSKLYFKVFPHTQNHFQTLIKNQCGIIEDYENNQQEQNKRSAFRTKTTIQLVLKEQQMKQTASKQQKKVIFQPNCVQYQMLDKKQRRKKLIKMYARQHNQMQFDEDENIDEQKPTFIMKNLIKKQIKF